jgi:hypothetical protein
MKFSNGTELRLGAPKYSKAIVRFYGIAGVFGIISWVIGGTAKDWFEGISLLAGAAGLFVFLLGSIAERKEWEAKRKAETK